MKPTRRNQRSAIGRRFPAAAKYLLYGKEHVMPLQQPCWVVFETKTSYRIKAIKRMRLPKFRELDAGKTALVPKLSVIFTEE